MSNDSLENEIQEFGQAIFQDIGKNTPSLFRKNFWAKKAMELSMSKPEFKRDLFRLVDVLPSLTSFESVIDLTKQYLTESMKDIHPLLSKMLQMPNNSIRGRITSGFIRRGVKEMAFQYIVGETPNNALKNLNSLRAKGLAFTADLLGEFCVNEQEALAYKEKYLDCLNKFSKYYSRWSKSKIPVFKSHVADQYSPICISIKLSALYSQTNPLNFSKSVEVLSERLAEIARAAEKVKALIYVDAEDSANNPIIYETFKNVFSSKEFKDFPFPGIVIQLYSRESEEVVKDFIKFARNTKPIAIRLVKGAYWDYETIVSKQNNWECALYTNKQETDANYEKISRLILDNHDVILPAFGSHNIRSLAHACTYAEKIGLSKDKFELQMLYGMAEPIAEAFKKRGYFVRLYTPIGELLPGMGYLVRRLLENTSNESFLRHTFFDAEEVPKLLAKPVANSY